MTVAVSPCKITHYWRHKETDVDIRIKKDGGDYDLDLIIDGIVEPVGFYKLKNAERIALDIMERCPDAENVERHTAF